MWVGMDLTQYSNTRDGAADFPLSRAPSHTDIAGGWSTAELSGLVLTLHPDGKFSLATPASLETRCASGVERGRWQVLEETGQLYFHLETDTNGQCGLSDLQAPLAFRKTGTGMLAVTGGTAAGRELPLVRR